MADEDVFFIAKGTAERSSCRTLISRTSSRSRSSTSTGIYLDFDPSDPDEARALAYARHIAATDGVSANTLIAEGGGAVVYRLADGTFYIGAPLANGKQYLLTFDELSANTAYSSSEVE